MVIDSQTEKGMIDHEAEAIKKTIFDNLEEYAQEAERTLKNIYRFNKGKAELEFNDVGMHLDCRNVYSIRFSKISDGSSLIPDSFSLLIKSKERTETKKVTVPRTGFLRFLGPEKKKKVKEKHEELSVSIPSYTSILTRYNGGKESSLVEIARNIKNIESVVGADDFTYMCNRIKELPPQIIIYMLSTARKQKQLNPSETLSVFDTQSR
jgi:hypothetical protein